MKYFVLFQNGNRRQFVKSTKNASYMISVFQLYCSGTELMDEFLEIIAKETF